MEPDSTTPGGATVSYHGQLWTLDDGQSVSIGRQSSCDIRIGGALPGPQDLGVSRRAGTVSHAQGRMWIRNDSTSLPVLVRAAFGQEYVLERRGDIVSLADPAATVVFEGQVRSYEVRVVMPQAEQLEPDGLEEPATLAPATETALPLSPRERRLLVAVCEPMLNSNGTEARPATYRQVALRLGLSDHTVRNALDALRERLLLAGIPGMIGSEAKDNLARYAVRSGSITPRDLELL